MTQASQTQPDSELLSPSGALNRFKLPTKLVVGEFTFSFERVRYGIPLSGSSGFGLLIDTDTPSEVINPQPIFPLPNTPPALLGIINLRGNLLPVFEIERLLALNIERPTDKSRRILVLGSGERTVAIVIEHLPEVPELTKPLSRIPPLPANLAEHVSAAYGSDDFVWLDFNHHSFFRNFVTRLSA